MRKVGQRHLQELMQRVSFPMIIYIHETGKVVAVNKMALNIMQQEEKDIVKLMQTVRRKRIPAKILQSGSKIFYGEKLDCDGRMLTLDIEQNFISLGKEHIVICMYEQTYKRAFSESFIDFVPRIAWKNNEMEIVGYNYAYQCDISGDIYSEECNISYDSEKILQVLEREKEFCEKNLTEDMAQYDILEELERRGYSGELEQCFVRSNRIPLQKEGDDAPKVLIVYNLLRENIRTQEQYNPVLRQNYVMDYLVARSRFIVYCRKGEVFGELEYVTENISELGYTFEEMNKKKMKWKDIIWKDDYLRIQEQVKQRILYEDRYVTFDYRIIKKDGSLIWIREKLLAMETRDDNGVYYLGFVTNMTQDTNGNKD